MAMKSRKFKANWTFIVIFNLLLNLLEINIGYVLSCTNQTATTFNLKFDFVGKNPALYQGLLGSSGVFGMTIGALIGGKIISRGRFITIIWTSAVGAFGSGLCMIENFPCILIGRTLFGFANGV